MLDRHISICYNNNGHLIILKGSVNTELRVLEYFLTVAREQNITKAAERLHLTQPTLSRQLTGLERELGCRLLIRGKRRVTLTEEGERLRSRAAELVELAEHTAEELKSRAVLNIGVCETGSLRQILSAVRRVQLEGPGVKFHLVGGAPAMLAERLAEGRLGLCILPGELGLSGLEYRRLRLRDRWGILLPSDSPLAARERIGMCELKSLPLILTEQTVGCGLLGRSEVEEREIAAVCDSLDTAYLMTEAGIGCAALPEGGVEVGAGLCFRPFEPPLDVCLTAAFVRGGLSRAGQRLLDALTES